MQNKVTLKKPKAPSIVKQKFYWSLRNITVLWSGSHLKFVMFPTTESQGGKIYILAKLVEKRFMSLSVKSAKKTRSEKDFGN